MFFYILYRLGHFLANKLPIRFTYWLGERLSDVHYFLSKKDRDAVIQNLSIVLKKDKRECVPIARKVFRNFGIYLVDFFRMTRLEMKDIKERAKIEGLDNLDNALKKKRGVVVITCHIGNWEMGGVITAMIGYKIAAVALTHRHKKINDFFIRQREKKGLKVIQINSVMKRCVSILLNDGLLALAGDRDFTDSGVTVDFFGVPTSIPKGPAMFSLKLKSPIVPAFFVRESRFNYRLIFDKPVENETMPGLSEDEMVKKITERIVPIMESYIRKYPDQWMVFRKFWETPTDAFVL